LEVIEGQDMNEGEVFSEVELMGKSMETAVETKRH